jgi:hypothetical protein
VGKGQELKSNWVVVGKGQELMSVLGQFGLLWARDSQELNSLLGQFRLLWARVRN